jgi:membrane fusion protein (multidrug efflux system)
MRTPVSATLLFSCLVLMSCGSDGDSATADKPALEAIPVEAATVSLGDVAAYYSTTATLEAENEAQVVAKISGIIKQILVEEGDRVRAGQALAVLDEDQYRLEVARAEANLARLQNDYNRNKEMFERNLISAEAFERVKFDMESQKATLELAKLNVTNSTIRASIDGVISERLIKEGNMVTMNQALFRITDMDPLHAIIYVPEHEMSKIRVGQTTLLDIDALPEVEFQGRVERISPIVDRTTGTFKVTVVVNDRSNRLKPGMFSRVRIVFDVRSQTMVVPKGALISEDGRTSVFVVQDSIVLKRAVEVGYTNGTKVEILKGLDVGTSVITVGQNSLRDSSKVFVIGSN